MMDYNWIYQQGLIIAIVLTIVTFSLYYMRSHLSSKTKKPLPPHLRGALSQEEKKQYDKGTKGESVLEDGEEELFTGEPFGSLPIETEDHVGVASQHNLPPEVYDYIYGETPIPSTSEQPKPSIDVNEFFVKFALKKIVEKDYDVNINQMDIKTDEKGKLSVGKFSGTLKPNQNEKTPQKKPEQNEEEEILF